MAKTSFTDLDKEVAKPTDMKTGTSETTPATPPPDTTMTTTANRGVALPPDSPADSEGEFLLSDMKLPRINLLQKMSDSNLTKPFGVGSFLYNKEVKLSDGETPWEMVPLRIKKQYQQNLPYGGDMPICFDTADEVMSNGGVLRYDPANPMDQSRFDEILHVQLAAMCPKDCPEKLSALFPYEHDGKSYGLAAWTLTGSTFRNVGKLLITHRHTLLRDGMLHGRYSVTSETRRNAKNEWAAGVAKFAGKNTPEAVAFFQGLM